MSNRAYGILAGVIGSALGAWFWNRRRLTRSARLTAPRDPGRVIFDNTPQAPIGGPFESA